MKKSTLVKYMKLQNKLKEKILKKTNLKDNEKEMKLNRIDKN